MNKTHQLMQFMAKRTFRFFLTVPVLFFCLNSVAAAEPNAIKDITFNSLPGNRIQLHIDFTQAAEKPLSFTIDNPARIAFDFNNTVSQLQKRKLPIGVGIAQSITTVTAKEKTRVILNLTETVPYQVTTTNNRVSIILDSESGDIGTSAKFADSQGRFSSGEKAVSKSTSDVAKKVKAA